MMNVLPVAGLLVMLGVLSIFQITLLFGAPFGKFAWGGAHTVLPLNLRFGAASAVMRYVFVGFIALNRASVLSLLPDVFNFWMMWIIVGHFGFGAVLSVFSRSPKEKIILAPYTFVMGVLSLSIALQ